MHEDPQVALRTLVAALERHLDTCLSKRPGSDQEIEEAYTQVADAFEKYEDLLEESFGEFLPIVSEEE
jgi:histone deacetylase complex regulatory component SIN3